MAEYETLDAYIRAQWEEGERDTAALTERLIKLVLDSPDPMGLLFPIVHAEVSARYRTFRLALETAVAPNWPGTRQPGSAMTHLPANHHLTLWQKLMDETVYVPGVGQVRYGELTVDHIDRRLRHLEGVAGGIAKSVAFLVGARNAITEARVTRLGEVPEDQLPLPPVKGGEVRPGQAR